MADLAAPASASSANAAPQGGLAGLIALLNAADASGKTGQPGQGFQSLLNLLTGQQNNGEDPTNGDLAKLVSNNGGNISINVNGQKITLTQDMLDKLEQTADNKNSSAASDVPSDDLMAQLASLMQQFPQLQVVVTALAKGTLNTESLGEIANSAAQGGQPNLAQYNLPQNIQDALGKIAAQPDALSAMQKMLADLQKMPAANNQNGQAEFAQFLNGAVAMAQNAGNAAPANTNAASNMSSTLVQTNAAAQLEKSNQSQASSDQKQDAQAELDQDADAGAAAGAGSAAPAAGQAHTANNLFQAVAEQVASANSAATLNPAVQNFLTDPNFNAQAGFSNLQNGQVSLANAAAAGPYAAAAQQASANTAAMQVALQIQQNAQNGQNSFHVQLSPADLGQIQVTLKFDGDRVSAKISADNQDTLDMMKQDSGVLNKALQEAGLQTDAGSLEFSLGQSAQQFTQNSQNNSGSNGFGTLLADGNTENNADDQAVTQIALLGPGRVDVKL